MVSRLARSARAPPDVNFCDTCRFTPNVDTLDNYKSFFPDDVNTVDIIGVCVPLLRIRAFVR